MMPRISHAATVLAATALVVVATPVPAFADGVRADQWYLDALDVEKAHELSQGEGITIGVIDSGIDATHPDLEGNVKAGKDFGTSIDDGLRDSAEHGTSVASLIVGQGHGAGNANGIMGIAPKAEVLSAGVDWNKDDDPNDFISEAIKWQADQGVDIISLSYGSSIHPDDSSVAYATGKDIPVVAGAGNKDRHYDDEYGDVVEKVGTAWPAQAKGAIPVAGTARDGSFWDGSLTLIAAAQQPKLGLSAPGDEVVVAKTGGGYKTTLGTSFSAPIVAGTLALIKSAYPELNYEQLTERLLFTVDDKGPKEFDDKFGWGIVNPYKALIEDVKHFKGDPSTQDDIVPLEDQGKNTGSEDKDKDGNKSGGDDNALTASSTSLLIPILIAVAVLLVVAFVVILVVAKRRKSINSSLLCC